jgi:phage tail protein X
VTTEGILRRALATKLAEKCSRHHLVVWDDPARHYDGVVESTIPGGWQLERYAGSWWDLRRRVEVGFSAPAPPKLVIYVPAAPPTADPLEEVRRAAGSFKRLLPTVLKDALSGEASASRIAELGARCSTLLAAEDALAGAGDIDPVLVEATGAHDAEGVMAAMLVGERRLDLPPATGPLLASLCLQHVGATIENTDDLDAMRSGLARHLVLAMITSVLGDAVAEDIVATWRPLTRSQTRATRGVVERVSRSETLARWGDLADRAAAELRLQELGWHDPLAQCDVVRAIDELAYHEAARRLPDDPGGAHALAADRIAHSRWLRWRDGWSTRALADLDAVRAIARFHVAVRDHPVPDGGPLDDVYRWYADGGWKVDRCQRLMEGARFGLARPGLDRSYTEARDTYFTWLDQLLTTTNRAASRGTELSMPMQCDTWARHIDGSGGVALVIVDAMRLELGHRLAEVLDGIAIRQRVECAVAATPTITAVGMANLLPEAGADGLSVELESGAVSVRVGGRAIRTVADRTAAYRTAAGRVEDHPLAEWLTLGDDVLKQRAGADLLVVRSQEIDAAGENGLATVRWSQIDATVDALAILITRLGACGITRAVVTADHGFLALGRPLDASRVRSPPAGVGIVEHGRAWLGRPATVPEGCTALALSDFGVRSEESLVVPDGMTVFAGAGSGFFHGGISPEEALVPVVVVDMEAGGKGAGTHANVSVEVPGGKVSAEAFSIRVALAGSLFASDVAVRITAAGRKGDPVARLVLGDLVDPKTGTVRLNGSTDAILTFLVTRDLDKGDTVEVVVLDAVTGRQLARTRAVVARNLRPEEEW